MIPKQKSKYRMVFHIYFNPIHLKKYLYVAINTCIVATLILDAGDHTVESGAVGPHHEGGLSSLVFPGIVYSSVFPIFCCKFSLTSKTSLKMFTIMCCCSLFP